MRLNNDCVRDILLFIEESTTSTITCVDVDSLVNALPSYTTDEIYYHIIQINKYHYVDDVSYADDVPYFIGDLTPIGRDFVDNVRDNKVWSATKKVASKLSSASLPILNSIAQSEITKLLGL